MIKKARIESAAIALGLCATLLAACLSMLSLRSLFELVSTFGGLGGRMDDLGSSILGLEKGAASTDSRLSRSFSGLEGRLSELSRRIEGLRREAGSRETSEIPSCAEAATGSAESAALRATRDGAFALTLEEADRAFAEGRFADAAARYGAIVAWAPDEVAPRVKRAISLYRANPADSSSYGLIMRDLQAASSAGEGGEEALEVLALVSVERQDWPKASECFDRLIALRPKDEKFQEEARECARCAEESAGTALR